MLRGAVLGGLAKLERGIGRRPLPLADATNFLLLQHPLALGTAVHATPLVEALADTVPGSRMIVAASGMGLAVFRHHPRLERVVATPNPLTDLLGAARELRRQAPFGREPYLVLISNGNQRTRVALQAVLSGGRERVGFAEAPELYRVPLSFDESQSQIGNNLRIPGVLGHPVDPARRYEPRVFFTKAELLVARRLLEGDGLDLRRPLTALVTQTSVTQQKSWRPERFRAVAERLRREWDSGIVFVGTASERAAIDELRAALPFGTSNLAGRTSLTELCALLSLCDLGVTLDTGTLHLGRAVGLPMVIVAPAWSPVLEWLPVDDPRFVILKNLTMETAPEHYIIDEVSVAEVLAAVDLLFSRYPPLTRGGRVGLLGP